MSEMFVVVRRALTPEGTVCSDQSATDTGSRIPLKLFATRAAAETHIAGLMAAVRRTTNPFPMLDNELGSEVYGPLKKLPFPLPPPDTAWLEDWREWWDLCQDEITDEQREQAWAILADHPLFEVVPVELGDGDARV